MSGNRLSRSMGYNDAWLCVAWAELSTSSAEILRQLHDSTSSPTIRLPTCLSLHAYPVSVMAKVSQGPGQPCRARLLLAP